MENLSLQDWIVLVVTVSAGIGVFIYIVKKDLGRKE